VSENIKKRSKNYAARNVSGRYDLALFKYPIKFHIFEKIKKFQFNLQIKKIYCRMITLPNELKTV
jgi:hypothetical protein